MKALTVFAILSLVQSVTPFRILAIYAHTGYSHFKVFEPFLLKLAEAGHEVTLISHFPREKSIKNFKDISLRGTLPIWKNAFTFDEFTFSNPTGRIMKHVELANLLSEMGKQACATMMKNQNVQNLEKGQFDLMLFEDFNSDCAMGLVHKLKLPSIALTSHVMMSWTMDNLGLINNPSYISCIYLSSGRRLNSLEAVESFLVTNFYKLWFYLFSQIPERNLLKEYVGDDLPPLEDIARNVSMIFVNTYFPLNGANPIPPNVLEVGGIYHGEVKELPQRFALNTTDMHFQDIKAFLDDAPDGVILFSMGSMLKATSLPKPKLKAFQEVFAELPQKVLWKWENDTMADMSANIKLVKWIPQFDALHHKNVKAFITHGGMLGSSEAVKAGVPAVAIPVFGDQFGNAAALEESGGGVYLDYSNITKESLKWALETVLDPKMKESAKKLSNLWNDRPMTAMDSALYWVNHVVKHGRSHLQPPYENLSLFRYLILDVIIILVIFILIFIYVCRKIYCRLKKVMLNSFKKKIKSD